MPRTSYRSIATAALAALLSLPGLASAQTVPAVDGVRGVPLAAGEVCGMQFYRAYRSGPLLAKVEGGHQGHYTLTLWRRGPGNAVLAELAGDYDSRGRREAVLAESQLERHFIQMRAPGPQMGATQVDPSRIAAQLDVYDARGRRICTSRQVDAIGIGSLRPAPMARPGQTAPAPVRQPAARRY